MSMLPYVAIFVVAFFGLKRWWSFWTNSKSLTYAPGPHPFPLIGNLLDMPRDHPWFGYARLAELHGDMVFMKVLNKHILVLSSVECVRALFEKRSSIYSDRPRLPMINELMNLAWSIPMMRYGDKWRRNRRSFYRYFNAHAIMKYRPNQLVEARKLALGWLAKPDDFAEVLRHHMSSSIVGTLFGIDVDVSENDWYIRVAGDILDGIAEAGVPGAFLVDVLPILKYVPEWLPFAGFQKKARHYRELMPEFRNRPLDAVMKAMETGKYTPCIVSDQLNECEDLDTIKNVSATAYLAAIDTLVATLQMFLLAMLMFPDVQKKAQEQLDNTTLGNLPELADLDNTPYIVAIINEVMRWQPVVPLGLPHGLSEDDEYEGFRIPKGTIVTANVWAMSRDKRTYNHPNDFVPERFIREDGTVIPANHNPDILGFGFGRRLCPGRHMAMNKILTVAATTLSCFDIVPTSEAELRELHERASKNLPLTDSGFTTLPLKLPLRLRPRRSAIGDCLRSSIDNSN